jgi:WD40 repeat protein
MSGLADRLSRLMVSCYPRRWRRHYRDELLALLDEHRSGPRTVANLALGALGTHLDPAYRREGMTMSGPGSPLRTAAQVAALVGALVVVLGGLLALEIRHEQQTDGVLTSDHSAGLTVSSDARLGVTAQANGIGFVIVWRIGAHPKVLAHFTGGAPVALAPDSPTLLATTPAAVAEWSLANPARPVRIATIPGPGEAQGIAYAPDHTTVAIAYARAIMLWNLASPAAPRRIATIPLAAGMGGPNAAASSQSLIAFSPDGRTLATATARNTVSLWDVSTPSAPQYLATVGRNTGPVAALAFSPAAPQLAYLSNGAVTVIDLTDPAHQAHAPIPGITGGTGLYQAVGGHSYALTYSPDGTRLTTVAVGSYQLATCTWNVTSLSQQLPATCRTGHTHLGGGITFTSGGTAIVGPNNHWANRGQDPLIIWPTLLG